MAVTAPQIDRLYRQHAPHLRRLVRFDVRAPDATIEDACQSAWSRLFDHRDRVRPDTALPWVARTALREAIKLNRAQRRQLSLDEVLERAGDAVFAGHGPSTEERFEQRERLRHLAALPVRQQRLLWLQGLGLSYLEMAAHEHCTRRTVERQLLKARQAVAASGGGQAGEA